MQHAIAVSIVLLALISGCVLAFLGYRLTEVPVFIAMPLVVLLPICTAMVAYLFDYEIFGLIGALVGFYTGIEWFGPFPTSERQANSLT